MRMNIYQWPSFLWPLAAGFISVNAGYKSPVAVSPSLTPAGIEQKP
jgi:hypothetical protein